MAIRVSRQGVDVLYTPNPTIRVSRQGVNVLYAPDSTIRVSRQHVEVLRDTPNIYEPLVTSTITFVGVATRIPSVYNESVSSAISFMGSTNFVGPKTVSADSLILFNEVAVQRDNIHTVSSSSDITFVETSDWHGAIYVSANSAIGWVQYGDLLTKNRDSSSTLNLNHSNTVDKIYRGLSQVNFTSTSQHEGLDQSALSQITFSQSVRHEPLQQNIPHILNFTQSTWVNIKSLLASSTIGFSHNNTVMKPIRVSATNVMTQSELQWNGLEMVLTQIGLRHEADVDIIGNHSATSVIPFIGVASAHVAFATGTSLAAINTISWAHKAIWNTLEANAISYLTVSHSVIIDAAKPTSGILTLTQTATPVINRALTAVSVVDFNQSITYTLLIGSTISQYSPFVGDSTNSDIPAPPPPTIDGPMAGIQVPFQLVYPSIGIVTDSVALKTPNLGNRDRLAFNRVLREARGGTLIVFADPIWPKVQTLVLTFSGLLQVEAQKLITFIEDHLGLEIGLIDWEHRYWRGVITSPEDAIIEDSFDNFTASFDFEGELDPSWNPQVIPTDLRFSATRSPQQDGYYVPNTPIPPDMSTTGYPGIVDANMLAGQPLYIMGTGLLNLAKADNTVLTQVIGFSTEDASVGETITYFTEGSIERIDWSSISNTVDLSAGKTYFLDPNTEGKITTTAPTTAGQFVVRVGRAVNARTLDIEVELPILL